LRGQGRKSAIESQVNKAQQCDSAAERRKLQRKAVSAGLAAARREPGAQLSMEVSNALAEVTKRAPGDG